MKSGSQRNFLVGLIFSSILMIGFVAIALVIKLRGKNEGIFNVYTVFQSASGLQTGYKVWLNGVTVGNVETVEIISPSRVKINLSIDTAYRKYIHRDAIAKLGSEGLMGNNLISIFQAPSTRETITAGDSIHAIPPHDYGNVMKKAIKMGRQFSDISIGFKNISAQFTSGKGSVSKIMNSKTIATKLQTTVSTAKKSIVRIKTSVKSFKK